MEQQQVGRLWKIEGRGRKEGCDKTGRVVLRKEKQQHYFASRQLGRQKPTTTSLTCEQCKWFVVKITSVPLTHESAQGAV
jgi:hypothetical protein